MSKNTALLIAGIVFSLVAALHLLRLYFAAGIIIAGYFIPMWVSWVGFFVAIILSALMFSARKNK